MTNDTIAAVSTPYGKGGISIIRISGKDAIGIADRAFVSKRGKKLADATDRTVNYGHIVSEGRVLDEVLVTVMRAPHTFTAEDVVEINCHGGLYVTKAVLDAVYDAGARPAEAGEFTKRAFINGRIDLTYAQSVMDMINAKTELQHRMALNHLNGRLAERIRAVRGKITDIAAYIQGTIDFPEELEEADEGKIGTDIEDVIADIDSLIANADKGIVAKEGITTVIVGKPNVGKSSILNLLADCDRAIVTDIPGTTRDTIEETVSLGNLVLKLVDTAGIRTTDDAVESIGVERAKALAETGELILFVIDLSREIDDEDREIFDLIKDKQPLIIANKSDISEMAEIPFDCDAVQLCAKSGDGLDELISKIEERFIGGGELFGESDTIITGEREKNALKSARAHLISGADTIKALSADMAIDDILSAAECLNLIDGIHIGDDIINTVFETYCVGK